MLLLIVGLIFVVLIVLFLIGSYVAKVRGVFFVPCRSLNVPAFLSEIDLSSFIYHPVCLIILKDLQHEAKEMNSDVSSRGS